MHNWLCTSQGVSLNMNKQRFGWAYWVKYSRWHAFTTIFVARSSNVSILIALKYIVLVTNCAYSSLFLTHWGRATHICVSKPTIIASDNGLSPGRRQAIIWNNAGILSIGLLGTNFSEIFNRNSDIFFQENAPESVVCEMADIFVSTWLC